MGGPPPAMGGPIVQGWVWICDPWDKPRGPLFKWRSTSATHTDKLHGPWSKTTTPFLKYWSEHMTHCWKEGLNQQPIENNNKSTVQQPLGIDNPSNKNVPINRAQTWSMVYGKPTPSHHWSTGHKKNTHTPPRTNRGPYTLYVMGPGLVIEGKLLHNFAQKNIKKTFPPIWQHGTPKYMCAIIPNKRINYHENMQNVNF